MRTAEQIARAAMILCLASGVVSEACDLALGVSGAYPATPPSALERTIWSGHILWLRYHRVVQVTAGALALPAIIMLPFSRGRRYLLGGGPTVARRWFPVLVFLAVSEIAMQVARWFGVAVPQRALETADLCVSLAAVVLLASALMRPPTTGSQVPSNNALQQTSGDGKLSAARC